MKPAFTVGIPWRPSPSRLKPYECVRRWWAENFPEIPVVTADSDSEIFSLSQARNNAVQQVKTDVVVLCDADTIAPLDSVKAAVADPVGVCWPHAVWRLIPAEYAERPFEDFPDAPALIEHPDGLGGVMVCTADEYWRLGGQDEVFQGWGHEDRCFHMVAQTLSTMRRIGGVAYSIEHNERLKIADSPGWDRNRTLNRELALPYERACDKPWQMRELLRIRAEESGDEKRKQLVEAGILPPPPQTWQQRWTANRR